MQRSYVAQSIWIKWPRQVPFISSLKGLPKWNFQEPKRDINAIPAEKSFLRSFHISEKTERIIARIRRNLVK
jgi:hypothetical protein